MSEKDKRKDENIEKATPPVIPAIPTLPVIPPVVSPVVPVIPSPPTTPTKVLVRELKREPANIGTEGCLYLYLPDLVFLNYFPLI